MHILAQYVCFRTRIEASIAESLDHIVNSKDMKNENYAKFLSQQKSSVSVSLVPTTEKKLLFLCHTVSLAKELWSEYYGFETSCVECPG